MSAKCKYCKGIGVLKADDDNLKCICKYADNEVSKDIKILINRIYDVGIFNGVNFVCDSITGAVRSAAQKSG